MTPQGATYKIDGFTDTITFNGRLTIVTCPCNITYAIPEELNQRLLEWSSGNYPSNYAFTHCPNGKAWHYTGKSELKQLRAQLENATSRMANAEAELVRQREQRDAARRHASALKGQITRIKNRIAAGVCPVCRANLGDRVRDHIGHEHPDWTLPETPEPEA